MSNRNPFSSQSRPASRFVSSLGAIALVIVSIGIGLIVAELSRLIIDQVF